MNAYPPIAEHGIVGDLQTAALVSSAGTIDWWCTPRFDSPSVFASLLDSERGGSCQLSADLPEAEVTIRQLYLSDTEKARFSVIAYASDRQSVMKLTGPDPAGAQTPFDVA